MAKKLTDKDFILKMEQLRNLIRSNVSAFGSDTPEDKAARIERARTDEKFFAETYFPHYCTDEIDEKYHKELTTLLNVENQPVLIAGPRDSSKSTFSMINRVHKIVFGRKKCMVLITKSEKHAQYEFILPLMSEFEHNERLISDFGDQRTEVWSLENIITKSGTRVVPKGRRSAIKSTHHGPYRVDDIVIEDLEDSQSPMSPALIKKVMIWIDRDVMKSVASKNWSFTYICNYFAKKTATHKFITDDRYKHWKKKIFKALYLDASGKAKSLWEAHLPVKLLLKEQKEDPITFKVERQQEPHDEDAQFQEEWFKRIDPAEVLRMKLPVVSFVDPAAKQEKKDCFKAIVFLAVDCEKRKYYVLHCWLRKSSKKTMIRTHLKLMRLYNSIYDIVEGNGFQFTLKEDYQELAAEYPEALRVKFQETTDNKLLRIGQLETLIEGEHILFCNGSDINELIEQFVYFPDGAIDGPDAVSLAKRLADVKLLKKSKKVKARVF